MTKLGWILTPQLGIYACNKCGFIHLGLMSKELCNACYLENKGQLYKKRGRPRKSRQTKI